MRFNVACIYIARPSIKQGDKVGKCLAVTREDGGKGERGKGKVITQSIGSQLTVGGGVM